MANQDLSLARTYILNRTVSDMDASHSPIKSMGIATLPHQSASDSIGSAGDFLLFCVTPLTGDIQRSCTYKENVSPFECQRVLEETSLDFYLRLRLIETEKAKEFFTPTDNP